METPLYLYISSGEKSVFYTLKLRFKFKSRGKSFYSSRFVKSLSVDFNEALKKARVLSERYDIAFKEPKDDHHWRMNQHASKEKIHGSTVLTFGKYQGKSIKSVLDSNPQYFSWLARNDKGNSRIISAIVDYLKQNRPDILNEKSYPCVDRVQLKKLWYDQSCHIGTLNGKIVFKGRVNKSWTTEGKWGQEAIVVLETVEGNHIKIKSRSADAFSLLEEEWYEIEATVIGHVDFKGIKQTLINRASIRRRFDDQASKNYEVQRQGLIDELWKKSKSCNNTSRDKHS